ncbi:MAG: hypothetical protein QGI83_11985 [Candidatus Latescibacteria bacterium]|nr:hypothetical protein [Candidatus Latescibacterota bacterium]
MSRSGILETVLENTEPLAHPRGSRMPLYLWGVMDLGAEDETEAESLIRRFDERGIAVVSTWHPNRQEESLAQAIRIGRIQQRLGLRVNVNANHVLHRFCNGDPQTAHVGADGEPFFDLSFSKSVKMGCPFALGFRYAEMRERVDFFARGYAESGVDVGFVFADWEIDGAIEWNGAWEASKRCTRCREHIPDIHDFSSFQTAIRKVRSQMQRTAYSEVMKSRFPKVLVGNYGVYPHNGYRYWYDYFEEFVEGAPFRADGRARYREWAHEFDATGYTFAMPVVYTWYPTFGWYGFENPDYRWFYNMLMVASNAGEHTPVDVPIISFVHWHTTSPPKEPDPDVKQFSRENYQELLWHMLLRGHDTLFLWCPRDEIAEEVRALHKVYAASMAYNAFLSDGEPVTFEVPTQQGPVVSALRSGNRLLVRRTDFTDTKEPVALEVYGKTVQIPRVEGACQIIELE